MLKKIISSPFFLFPLLTCIFFWPVSLQIFTFKNDALTYYYPVRTLISDALNNHELPLWTPFINMGYPLHADMQSGAWNPVIWIIAFLTNYSLAAFHYELIFYLAMGGIGFYYLGRQCGWNKYTALIIGFAYEFSGPVIDSMQFTTCISSACYIPFIFVYFRRLLDHNQPVVNALLTALFLYLLFTGGYPALFIITLYLLAAFLLFALFSSPHKTVFVKKIIIPLGIISIAFILLSLPAIISFVNHLPFIDRGKKQGLDFVLENPMPPSCMFSLISPFSTTATSPFFNTDILMRNIYIGLVPLLFLIFAVCNKTLRNNKQIRFFLITAFILFGMAWGSHFFLRQLAYYTLPLMDTFRHPALFRLFGVIFLLLIAGFAISEWSKKNYHNPALGIPPETRSELIRTIPRPTVENVGLLRKIILTFGLIIFITGVLVIISGDRLIPLHLNINEGKNLLASLDFSQRFLVQLPFIIATACFFYFVAPKNNARLYILLLSVSDLFFATQLNMPVTVIGAENFTATELSLHRNPERFPLPGNKTVGQNAVDAIDSTNAYRSNLPYAKKIGRNDYFITPGNLSSQEKFYESPVRETVFNNRVLYFADTLLYAGNYSNMKELSKSSFAIVPNHLSDSIAGSHSNNDTISINKLSANTVECAIETGTPRLLVLLQNAYPGWKVFIDGNETPIIAVNISFMGVSTPAGKHTIVFSYHPTLVIYAWYVSLFSLLIWSLFLLRHLFSKGIFSK